ncbi:MAG: DinB family protein [Actinomycetes bacterium]
MSDSRKSSQDLLAEFIKNGKEFISIAKSISSQDINKVPIAGEWSAAYVLHHMCDGEMHFATRYLTNLAETTPNIIPFNEDFYPDRLQYAKRDALASLVAIEGIQVAIANILGAIPESDWSRTSTHEERGLMTLADLVALATDHSNSHAGQLNEIVKAL